MIKFVNLSNFCFLIMFSEVLGRYQNRCFCETPRGNIWCSCLKHPNTKYTTRIPNPNFYNITILEDDTEENTEDDNAAASPPPFFLPDYDEDETDDLEESEEVTEMQSLVEESENLPNYDRLCRFYPTFCKIFLKLSINNVNALKKIESNKQN